MKNGKLIIAVIDDSIEDAEILRRCLNTIPDLEFELVRFCDADEAFEELPRNDVDLVFLDYLLGKTSGIDLLKKFRSAGDIRPMIVYTGHGNPYIVAEMMRSGADDFLDKNDLHASVVQRSMIIARTQCRERLSLQNQPGISGCAQQPIQKSALRRNQPPGAAIRT